MDFGSPDGCDDAVASGECEVPRHFGLAVLADMVPDLVYSLAPRHLLAGASAGSEVGAEDDLRGDGASGCLAAV